MQGVPVSERKMTPDDGGGLIERLTERRYEGRKRGRTAQTVASPGR